MFIFVHIASQLGQEVSTESIQALQLAVVKEKVSSIPFVLCYNKSLLCKVLRVHTYTHVHTKTVFLLVMCDIDDMNIYIVI